MALRNNKPRPTAPTDTQFTVGEPAELMAFLMKALDGISRTRVKTLLTNRVVLVDNVITTQYNFPLNPGVTVTVCRNRHNHEFHNPMLKIVYEDDYIIVVEKKEGLLSVATDHVKERTAQHILQEYVKLKNRRNRIFVVHRLDRETSGLMMYAKDEQTQNHLRDNWHDLVTDRRYVAVVQGDMEEEAGTIRSFLTDRKLYVASKDYDDGQGKLSVTHFRTIKRANGLSLLELNLETGRKNQIRVHLSDRRHPIVGDERYGSDINPIGRVALHAFKLCFTHPVTHQPMKFETPYPTLFKKLMQKQQQ